MPLALDVEVRNRVWRLCLSGETRKNIAERCGIAAGSVTNIINEKTKGLDGSEYGAIRELAVYLKKEGMTFADLSSMYRRHNYAEKLGANEQEVELLIANLVDQTKSIPVEKTANMVNQLYELSKSESIPPTEVPGYINRKLKMKQTLEEEEQRARAILDQENVEIRALEEYKELREEFKRRGISIESSCQFASVLQTIDRIGYYPSKVLRELARIKSLSVEERRLKKNCKIWESRAAQYKEVLPMCERVVSLGIRIPLLLALETAVMKAVELDRVSAGSAPYRVLQEIEDYNKLGGIKKQLFDATLQLSMMKEILGRQNEAVVSLAKLQFYGVTDDQILNLCRGLEVNGYNLNPCSERNSKVVLTEGKYAPNQEKRHPTFTNTSLLQ